MLACPFSRRHRQQHSVGSENDTLRGDATADAAGGGAASWLACVAERGWSGDGEGRCAAAVCSCSRWVTFVLGLSSGWCWCWCWARTGLEGVQAGISNHGVDAMGGVVYE
jgi:hypothetical protein